MSQLIAPLALVAALLFSPGSSPSARVSVREAASSQASTVEIYQLVLRGPTPTSTRQNMVLVMHADEKGLSGYLVSDTHAVQLDSIRLQGGILHAALSTTDGRAELTLNTSEGQVQGTITVRGGRTFSLSGERTV